MSTDSLDLTENIEKLQKRYDGSFGDVHQGLYLGSNEDEPHSTLIRRQSSLQVAVKALRFSVEQNGTLEPCFREAVATWTKLRHPNIVPFLGITSAPGPYTSLVSMWMPHGTLQSFLADCDDDLPIAHRLHLVKDIATGIAYLHSRNIAHGDLTGSNVLLDGDCRARLADFGLLSLLRELPNGSIYINASTKAPRGIRYIAHEGVLRLRDYSFESMSKSDIYSFGCIMLQVLSGKEPWSEISKDFIVIKRLSERQKPSRPDDIEDIHWLLIDECLSPSQDQRPSAEDVVPRLNSMIASLPSTSPPQASCADVR